MLTVPLRIQLPKNDAEDEVKIPEPDKDSTEEPAGIIVEKRATRKSTFYKVNDVHHTWRAVCNLAHEYYAAQV